MEEPLDCYELFKEDVLPRAGHYHGFQRRDWCQDPGRLHLVCELLAAVRPWATLVRVLCQAAHKQIGSFQCRRTVSIVRKEMKDMLDVTLQLR